MTTTTTGTARCSASRNRALPRSSPSCASRWTCLGVGAGSGRTGGERHCRSCPAFARVFLHRQVLPVCPGRGLRGHNLLPACGDGTWPPWRMPCRLMHPPPTPRHPMCFFLKAPLRPSSAPLCSDTVPPLRCFPSTSCAPRPLHPTHAQPTATPTGSTRGGSASNPLP